MKQSPEPLYVMKSPWRRGQFGGSSTSLAKQKAARINGRKGGRPSKTQAVTGTTIALTQKPKHASTIALTEKPKHIVKCGPA